MHKTYVGIRAWKTEKRENAEIHIPQLTQSGFRITPIENGIVTLHEAMNSCFNATCGAYTRVAKQIQSNISSMIS